MAVWRCLSGNLTLSQLYSPRKKCLFDFTNNKQDAIAVFIKAVDSLTLDSYTSAQRPIENTRFMDINIIILGFIVDLFELLFILQQIQ